MRFVIQRVKHADVKVEDRTIGEIGQGLLVFVGISASDREETADKMLKKLLGLRIFEDENGKTNWDLKKVAGELLIISQFICRLPQRKPAFLYPCRSTRTSKRFIRIPYKRMCQIRSVRPSRGIWR